MVGTWETSRSKDVANNKNPHTFSEEINAWYVFKSAMT
jgi:hypothetical protein